LLSIIIKRQRTGPNLPDDDLIITLYEPWEVDDDLPSMPLWASRKIEEENSNIFSTEIIAWVSLLRFPWLLVSRMPLEVHKALIESNGEMYHRSLGHLIATDYMGTTMDVVEMKPPYTNHQKADTTKYIMQLDKSE
jgi:hypothetical protein